MKTKNEIRVWCEKLMTDLEFYEEGKAVLLGALDTLFEKGEPGDSFLEIAGRYDEDMNCDYTKMLSDVKELAGSVGIHHYTLELLLFVVMAEKLLERYRERGLDEAIYYNSLTDLRCKLDECRLVEGIMGSFVAFWFPGFYNLTRFAFGRLQYEIIELPKDFEVEGMLLEKGTKAINIHIPRTGTRLYHEEVLDSYRRAAEYFADVFVDSPIIFTCSTWLFYPWYDTVWKKGSNLYEFYHDFTIVDQGEYDGYGFVWRLFDMNFTGDISALPADTSFRRVNIERMKEGKPLGWGRGIFIYKG